MIDPKLSPSDAIFVFADIHAGIVDLPLTVPREELLRAVEGLAELAELFDIPSFALSIPSLTLKEVEFVPEVTEKRKKLTHLQRTSPDSFEHAAIRDAFAATGRKTLVVSGIATEVVVHWLVVSGRANGYNVHVVTDACGGLSTRSEQAALARFTSVGATMTSVAALAGELSGDFTRPLGRAAIEVVYKMIGIRGPGH